MRVIKKPMILEAIQWFKHGDHPKVYKYVDGLAGTRQELYANLLCSYCRMKDDIHGWIECPRHGCTVCPSDWIIKDENGEYSVCKDKDFKELYDIVDVDTRFFTEPKGEWKI